MINYSMEGVEEAKRFTEYMYRDVIVPPEIFDRYYDGFTKLQKTQLYHVGITPDTLSVDKQKKMFKVLQGIANFEQRDSTYIATVNRYNPEAHHKLDGTTFIPMENRYKFLGAGQSGVVIFKQWIVRGYNDKKKSKKNINGYGQENITYSAFKFRKDIRKEYALLEKVKNTENIINAKNAEHKAVWNYFDEIGDFIELEYIPGDSLENIVKNNGPIDNKKVFQYTKDIINGLIDMKRVGILYHRDIRPGNIMIDSKKDSAIILDLEYAETNKNKMVRPNGNRRFNGPNDLSSVSQTGYYAVTGKSVFHDGEPKNIDLSDIANAIVNERNKAYADINGASMNAALKRIDKNIKDKEFAEALKKLLIIKV